MTETKSTAPVRVIEETSAYWRVLFDYPPFNIVDATIFEGLQELLARMEFEVQNWQTNVWTLNRSWHLNYWRHSPLLRETMALKRF